MKLQELINELNEINKTADKEAEIVIDVFNNNGDCCHTFIDMDVLPCNWDDKNNAVIQVKLK